MLKCEHQNKLTHPHPKRNFVPTAVATKSGQVPVNAAKQSSPRAATSISTARPVNTAATKSKVNDALPTTYSYFKAHSPDQGIFDSRCSRHMIGKKFFLTDYQEIDGGFVAFGGSPKGGKITGKGKIRTGKLDFEDTEYLVLSPDFKLVDESQVLLRVPRQNNMCSFDLKNVVPTGGLTCLFAKAIIDESNLWHRRLGHINFKTINKLVRGNLVRGLPSKLFENDQTCVAYQKGKQHKASCKTRTVSSICKPLQLLHMDLFGPVSMKSINKKSYYLVVTDDFSRFSWVFFLATKDETHKILKNIITGIENQTDHKVKTIRYDNGTEFKNRIMNEFYEMKGRKPALSFMRPFGCPVTIINTLDHLDPKSQNDESSEEAGKKNEVLDPAKEDDKSGQGEATNTNNTNRLNTVSSSINTVSSSFTTIDPGRERVQRNEFESVFGQDKDANGNNIYRIFTPVNVADPLVNNHGTGIFNGAYDDEDVGAEADLNNLETTMNVKQKNDGIFICQDKYVADILKNFDFVTVKIASTPIETNKALLKDEKAEDVDWDDGVERATTTAASLDATQASGGSPRCQEATGGFIAQISNSRIEGSYVQILVPDRVLALETDLRQTKKVYSAAYYTKLIMKVKKLEKTINAAKVLADAAKNVHTYTRRRKAVSTDSGRVSTAKVNKDKGKGIMTESEPEQTKTKLQQRQERAGYEAAIRLQEQLDEEERRRIARVHEEASSFNIVEWENIQATIEVNKELAQRIQAEEREKYSEAEKARLLAKLIN
ncbi:putative ribonuclease H-like domain-containing protein [Tanacetum coccineum]